MGLAIVSPKGSWIVQKIVMIGRGGNLWQERKKKTRIGRGTRREGCWKKDGKKRIDRKKERKKENERKKAEELGMFRQKEQVLILGAGISS